MKYLGIDTSNYRTSAALFSAEDSTWQNEGRLLDVPEGTIGLRQSDAVFQHTIRLHQMLEALPRGIGGELGAIGVSTRPRAVDGSYMPCFLAGENVARSAAHLCGVPLILCSHQQGHLAAAALSAGAISLLKKSFLAWHLSGGTTELLLVHCGIDGLPEANRIGGTTDLAAGQLIDRAGQRLKLTFPAGAALEQLALSAQHRIPPFAPKVINSEFSLSGVENKVQKLLEDGASAATIALFTMETISKAIIRATEQARVMYPLPLLCAGGVMSNAALQQEMITRFGAYTSAPQLSGDNAVGVAVLAALQCGESLCKTIFIPSQS